MTANTSDNASQLTAEIVPGPAKAMTVRNSTELIANAKPVASFTDESPCTLFRFMTKTKTVAVMPETAPAPVTFGQLNRRPSGKKLEITKATIPPRPVASVIRKTLRADACNSNEVIAPTIDDPAIMQSQVKFISSY